MQENGPSPVDRLHVRMRVLQGTIALEMVSKQLVLQEHGLSLVERLLVRMRVLPGSIALEMVLKQAAQLVNGPVVLAYRQIRNVLNV